MVGQVAILDFDISRLRGAFRTTDNLSKRVEYLAGYLGEMKVQSMMHEHVYMDRHYLEEFAEYYSRSFRLASAGCERLLFFSLPRQEVEAAYDLTFSADGDTRESGRETLQEAYLGFSVVRPLLNASVGRTVLKTYPPDQDRRRYTALRPYVAQLPSGSRLEVAGMAFQEQDRGAAVCASTALWSALQRVAHVQGNRSSTPVEVTHAAASPFPASVGLDDRQMARALANLGYTAEYFAVAANRPLFRACVAACLDSSLPVVLMLSRRVQAGDGTLLEDHAVTVSGYRLSEASAGVSPPDNGGVVLRIRGAALDVVYVHDDNLGPYAHYEFRQSSEKDLDGHERLVLRRGNDALSVDYWQPDDWWVDGALVPKPADLRMAMSSLVGTAWRCRTLTDLIAPGLNPEYQPMVTTGIEYKRDVVANGDAVDVRIFLEELCLPRHVGIVAVWVSGHRLFDFVLDVSETDRSGLPLLAVVAPRVLAKSGLGRQLQNVGIEKECPVLLGKSP